MKSKSIILLAVSLGFGLVAAFGISQVIGKSGGASKAPVQRTRPVVIAKVNLDIDSELTEENVTLAEWPEEMVPEDAVTSLEDLENMLTKAKIYKDSPIMNESLVSRELAGIIKIAPGHTILAINVAADDTIAGLLQAGDHVDLMAVFQGKDGGLKSAFTRTFLRKVKVFSIGEKTVKGERGDSRGESIVSVEVTKRDAEKIVLVQRFADIKMTMVSKDDPTDDELNGDGTDFQQVLYGSNRKNPYESLISQKQSAPSTAPAAPRELFPGDSGPKKFMQIHTATGIQKYEFKDGENLPVLLNPVEASYSSKPTPLNGPAGLPEAPKSGQSGNTGQSSPELKSGSAGKSSQDEFAE